MLSARLAAVLLYLLVGLVALLPRIFTLGTFLDSDERNFWLGRSDEFLIALQHGDFAATAISTHPGVTTMWLGSAGIVLRHTLLEWGIVSDMPFATMLTLMRLPVVLAHVVGVLVGYALLRRMLPLAVATLAALLWAADPFAIAYQRILHVDGLATTFAILALLAACLFWNYGTSRAVLVLSAVCGALAVLSKSPALALVPVVGLLALASRWWDAAPGARLRGGGRAVGDMLLWGGVFVLTIVLAWPAIWANPPEVYRLLRLGVEVEGGSPHVVGNFFLGQPDSAPGPLYYPVALALRTTPITLPGLLLLPLVWQRGPEHARTRRSLAVLALFVIVLVVGLSLFPKKLNRYSVLAFPALDVLAAVGLAWAAVQGRHLWQRLRGGAPGSQAAPRGIQAALVGGVALLAVVNAAGWHPYYMLAFNQALGGAQMGANTFLMGDGEGLDQVADWLHQQPDITGVTVASTMINSFQPLLNDGVQSVSPDEQLSEQVGYVMVYLRHTQRGPLWSPFDQFYPHETPIHTVRLHGVEYAWIYEVPPPIDHALDVRFGSSIELRGYEIDTSALSATGMLSLTTQWRAAAPLEHNYLMFAHILDQGGQRVGQTDVPPGGPDAPTSAWEVSRAITWVHPVPAPADLPPGRYWLAIGLYNPQDMTRLPVSDDAPAHTDAPDGGRGALLLPLELP